MASARRLPAVAVSVAPPPAVQALPRMDVAVFVGFAATGPLDLPVVVESVAQYAAVFGADTPLAWDDLRGERVRARLGSTVRAFFANGGRRCWVIRTALSAAAEAVRASLGQAFAGVAASANRFALPGVLAWPAAGGTARAALAAARCEGSWSDALRVRCALVGQSFAIDGWGAIASPAPDHDTLRTGVALQPGDLLQLGFPDTVVGYASVERVTLRAQASLPYEVQVRLLAGFERLAAAVSPSDLPGLASIAGFADDVAATLRPIGDMAVDPGEAAVASLEFETPLPAAIEPGHWARWHDGVSVVWLRIDDIARSPALVGSPATMDPTQVRATVSGPAWRELGAALPLPDGPPTQATRLQLDVVAGFGTLDSRLRVGLVPGGDASFWSLQTDAALYAPADDTTAPVPVAPDVPRFPLAPEAGDDAVAWLPLGVDPLYGAAVAPLPAAGTALERDGLAAFGPALFIDPELAGDSVNGLTAHAEDIRLLRAGTRPLLGLHAAIGIGRGGLFNEASLIALPDLMHLGWQLRDVPRPPTPSPAIDDLPLHWATHRGGCDGAGAEPPLVDLLRYCESVALGQPVLSGPQAPMPPGAYRLAWSDVPAGATCAVLRQEGAAADSTREVFRGVATQCLLQATHESTLLHQVFVVDGDERSAGSNVVATRVLATPDFGVFLDCSTHLLAAPVLDGPDAPVAPGPYRLAWSDSEPGATYVLVEAASPDFADAREVFRGPATEYVALAQRAGDWYYQAWAERGDERSAGSNAVVVVVRGDDWVQLPPDDDEAREAGWLAVQRALLRLAAASGELFAVLSLPRHFRSHQAVRYAQRLRSVRAGPAPVDELALGFNEARALSYGALYFPWLQADVRSAQASATDAAAPVGLVPPDGVATGVLAGRASQRGAWIAPANEPMKDVVALVPQVPAADRQALLDAQVNLLRDDPRGFLTLSADTLALESDVDLRPINVRRLLILLRRLALRRGVSYVFEPNGPVLRRAVQRGFDTLLGDLYQRGAFAGATPEQSFRVVADDTINTPQDADAGRFFVELRVAPAIPMHFLTLRLAQSGERLSAVEEP